MPLGTKDATYWGSEGNVATRTRKAKMKKNNKILLPTMDDFFQVCKEIRQEGVTLYDEKTDTRFRCKVVMDELADHDPDVFDREDSLEATLYGVYEATLKDHAVKLSSGEIHHSETWSSYRMFYRLWKDRFEDTRKEGKDTPDDSTLPYFALFSTFEEWLSYPMMEIFNKCRDVQSGNKGKKCSLKLLKN